MIESVRAATVVLAEVHILSERGILRKVTRKRQGFSRLTVVEGIQAPTMRGLDELLRVPC